MELADCLSNKLSWAIRSTRVECVEINWGGVSEDKLRRMPSAAAAAAAAELYSNSTLFVPATLYTVQNSHSKGRR